MNQWHFYDKFLRRWVVLLVGPYENFINELTSYNYTEIEDVRESLGACLSLDPSNNDRGHNCMVVWMSKWDSATLVHEISHLVMHSFEECGVPISIENTETFAFYTEYWWREINYSRRKWPKGNRPKDARA